MKKDKKILNYYIADEGMVFKRKNCDFYTPAILLADWDTIDNYEEVPDPDVNNEEE